METRGGDAEAERLREYARRVFGALGGAMTSAMVYLGDRLGLYACFQADEALSSGELARRSGCQERWVREWLFQQGAAGLLEHRGDGRFALPPEGRAVLADETHPAFGAGFFSHLPQTLAIAEQLPESFRSGLGLPYDALGPEGARGIERGLSPWLRHGLVRVVLPRLPEALPALSAGVQVADVGCGAGAALVELARGFPASGFHGYDISRHALARARENAERAGAANASFHDAVAEPLPQDGRFALVLCIDCLHDMTDPEAVARQVRRALAPGGSWLVVEIKARESYEENARHNPMAPLMYGTSVLTCLSSALSEPGGAGLGTLGLPASRLEALVRRAGFEGFEILDVDHPVNAFYRVF